MEESFFFFSSLLPCAWQAVAVADITPVFQIALSQSLTAAAKLLMSCTAKEKTLRETSVFKNHLPLKGQYIGFSDSYG